MSATPIAFIDLQTQRARIAERVDAAIAKVLAHGAFVLGPEITELERRLAAYAGVKHALTCSSGTDAILLALLAQLRATRAGGRLAWLPAVLSLLAIGSKETGFAAPVLCVLAAFFAAPGGGRARAAWIALRPQALAVVLALSLRWLVLGDLPPVPTGDIRDIYARYTRDIEEIKGWLGWVLGDLPHEP